MMAQLGADYSSAPPGGAALKAAGVAAVGRYLAADARGITAAEYRDLVAHGIGVWLVRESQTPNLSVSMLNGYARGVAEATAALSEIARIGLPANSPVFWAADFDIAPGSPRVAQAEAYVDGWNTIIPAGRRGGYGGLWFLAYIRGRGKVEFLWECASTSFRHGVNPAQVPLNIQQTTKTPPLPGTDHNYIYTLATLEDDMTPEEHTMLQAIHDAIFKGGESMPDAGRSIGQSLQGLTNRVSGIGDLVEQKVTRDGVNITQAADAAATGTLVRHLATTGVPVDVDAVAAAVAAKLPASPNGPTHEDLVAAFKEAQSGLTLKATS